MTEPSAIAEIAVVIHQCAATPTTLRTRSTCRTCAAALRTLLTLLQGDETLNATKIIGQVDLKLCTGLLACLAWGSPPLVPLGNEQTRPPDGALATLRERGALAGFYSSSVYSGGGRDHQRQTSSSPSSIGNGRKKVVWDAESAASTSELDGDAADVEDTASICRLIRQRSLACLNELNVCAAKKTFSLWPVILCDERRSRGEASLLDVIAFDVATSIRCAACRVVEAYMHTATSDKFFVGAEEGRHARPFTAMSTRMAAMASQCRARLASVLGVLALSLDNAAVAKLVEAVLRCTIALVQATAVAKFRLSHADVLRPITLELCASADASVAVRAYALLAVLIAGDTTNSEASPDLVDVVAALQDPQKPAWVKIGAWNALTASKETLDLAELAADHLAPQVDGGVRQAAAAFVLAVLQRETFLPNGEHIPQSVVAKHLPQRLAIDELPLIRAVAADCLAICAPDGDQLARLATDDADSTVRAAAARAIGVAIQRRKEALHVDTLRRALEDTSSLVRQRASWSWGNLCEAKPLPEYLIDCLALQGDDDRIVIHVVRSIGALLAAHRDWRDSTAVGEALQWLATLLGSSKDPKMRWNTCASLGRTLVSPNSAQHIVELDSGRDLGIIKQLSSIVAHDKTFKTRLVACHAIRTALESVGGTRLAYAATEIRANVDYAVQRIDEQTAAATFKEAQLHAVPLQTALHKLAGGDFFTSDTAQ